MLRYEFFVQLLYEKVPYQLSTSIRAIAWSWPQITCDYHYHPEVEIVWIQKSQGRMSIGNYQGEFKEGDLFLIGANVPHVFYNTDEHHSLPNAAKAVVIQFSENFLGEKSWQIPELRSLGQTLQIARKGLQFRGADLKENHSLMKKIVQAQKENRIIYLLQLLSLWAKEQNHKVLGNLIQKEDSAIKLDSRIQKMLDYLSEHLQERITLLDLSKRLFMTTSSLSRLFRKKMGITIVDYVNTQRIALSCQLLIGGNRTITEICFDVGFENLSNFNRQFLKRKKCSPSEFRRFYEQNRKETSCL